MNKITENTIEKLAIKLHEKQGYQYIHAFTRKLYGGKRS